ncbi:translation initiation factor IF-2-like [Chelonia mydas]|uniref:translation initiation factor IF-2-like n=1 Tax=Chelonia mydas TaxID=8469 RepID=UPI001CA80798|nr:translation initiation factor IF-2-like [Chelonia mydas]
MRRDFLDSPPSKLGCDGSSRCPTPTLEGPEEAGLPGRPGQGPGNDGQGQPRGRRLDGSRRFDAQREERSALPSAREGRQWAGGFAGSKGRGDWLASSPAPRNVAEMRGPPLPSPVKPDVLLPARGERPHPAPHSSAPPSAAGGIGASTD